MLRYTFPLYLLVTDTILASEEKGGMPQLNPESFSSQIFWLILLFVTLFLINHFFFLPKIKKIRNKREETIQSYLDEAKKLNDSFNSLVEKMNKEFNEAKIEQNTLIKKAFEENKKIFDKKILEINNDFEEKKSKLNSDIEKNKELISNELPKLCVNLSDNLYEKIMGEKNKGSVSDFKKIIGDDKQ